MVLDEIFTFGMEVVLDELVFYPRAIIGWQDDHGRVRQIRQHE